ncbi:MAG: radical SAM protein, partial [Planctomycetota bacterium]
MIELPALEYHLAHGCNLSCQQCSHYKNFRLAGAMPTPAEAEVEYEAWHHRIVPKRFALLGGEPMLNPKLIKHLLLAREYWPNSNLMLVTNGFFFDWHLDLPEILVEIDCRLEVSQQGTHDAYLLKFRKAKQTVWRWREEYPVIQIKIRQSHQGWMRQHR